MNSDKIEGTEQLQRIVSPLLAWFAQNRRELEWRADPLPYYVWVSEIMLQQTRVSAVRPYFRRFVRELPDVRALARCEEEKLLKLWEGLGYYSRVRNMQRAARVVEEQYQGVLPRDPDLLRALPGIGSYTAGAIASIAYGVPEPAVDGNVLRVLARSLGRADCIDEPKVRHTAEELLRSLLRTHADIDPGAFNQALMELGALVCLPNGAPLCVACPLREDCSALSEDRVSELPVRRAKRARRVETRTVLVVRDATHTLLHKRPDRGLLAGLWELPNFDGHLSDEEALRAAQSIGLKPLRIQPLPEAKHIFTHVEWHMTGYLVLVEEMQAQTLHPPWLITSPEQAGERTSIPAAFAAYTDYLNIRLGQSRFEDGQM